MAENTYPRTEMTHCLPLFTKEVDIQEGNVYIFYRFTTEEIARYKKRLPMDRPRSQNGHEDLQGYIIFPAFKNDVTKDFDIERITDVGVISSPVSIKNGRKIVVERFISGLYASAPLAKLLPTGADIKPGKRIYLNVDNDVEVSANGIPDGEKSFILGLTQFRARCHCHLIGIMKT
jgi:hypothetical protein